MLTHAEAAVTQGYKRVICKVVFTKLEFPKGFFQIRFSGMTPVIIGREHLREFYAAPADHLSSRHSIEESIQLRYTFGKDVTAHHYHIDVVRTKLTKHLPGLYPAILDDVDRIVV